MKKRTEEFLDKHGRQLGAALCGLSALVMVGIMSLLFVLVAPEWVEVQERLSAGLARVEVER